MTKPTVAFVVAKAKVLASKYRNAQVYQDLNQEGIVKGLEMIQAGVDCEQKVASAMRRCMNDYMNLAHRPVSVPATGSSRKALAAIKRGDPPEETDLLLLQALLHSQGEPLDNLYVASVSSHTKDFEVREYSEQIKLIMNLYLDKVTSYLIDRVYLQEVSQVKVAQELDLTPQRVKRLIDNGLRVIRRTLQEGT
jgi:DNA-directed RNA polymerase specialized sigma24 family protein